MGCADDTELLLLLLFSSSSVWVVGVEGSSLCGSVSAMALDGADVTRDKIDGDSRLEIKTCNSHDLATLKCQSDGFFFF